MRDLSISARLIAGFLVVVGLIGIAAAIAINGLRVASTHYEEALNTCSGRAFAGMTLQAALLEQVKAQKNYLLRHEPEYLREAAHHGERVRAARTELESAAERPSETALLTQLDIALDALDGAFQAHIGARQTDGIQTADQMMRGKATAVVDIIDEIVASAREEVLHKRANALESVRRTRLVTVGLIACIAVAALGIGIALSLSITRPLQRLQSQIHAVADDSAVPPRPAVAGRNEIADIARAFHDLLQRASLLREMELRSERLLTLSSRAARAQEQERERIARELHDGLGQALTAIKLDLSAADRALGADVLPAKQHLAKAQTLADETLDELRRLVFDLRPPALDNLGLVAALESYTRDFKERSRIAVALEADFSESRLPSDVETALYRICQEALANVWKHAHASQSVVRLEQTAERVTLTVTDNGVGFDTSTVTGVNAALGGVGLLSMERRAEDLGGNFRVESQCGAGTSVHVSVPLHAQRQS